MKQILFFLSVFFFSANLIAQGGGLKQSQLKDIEAIMAPLRLKVEAELKKADTKMYADYLSELKKAASITDTKKQKAALTDLETKYLPFLKKGYAVANIDEAKMKSKLGDILKGSGYTITFTQFLGIVGHYAPIATPPVDNGCKELLCPFQTKNSTMSQQDFELIGTSPAFSDCGGYASTYGAIASGREEFAAIGEFFTINSNIARVEVSCKTDYGLSGSAFAFLGGGYADASVGIVVKGTNVDRRFEHVSDWALAPVVWYSAFEKFGQNDIMQASFVPSSTGGDYKIQAYAKSYAMSAVFSGSSAIGNVGNTSDAFAFKDDAIDFIKVCQIKK